MMILRACMKTLARWQVRFSNACAYDRRRRHLRRAVHRFHQPGSRMTRRMYDSANLDGIPSDASMVAYYVDGRYGVSTEPEMRRRWPAAVLVPISAVGSNAGIVGDVETGDLTPAGSVDWVLMRRAAGVTPSLYCNRSTWPAVRAAFGYRLVAEPSYWIAAYDGVRVIPSGAVAKQYADPAAGSGGDYDVSIVADYWPGIDAVEPAPVARWEDCDVKFYMVTVLGVVQQHIAGVSAQGVLRHMYWTGDIAGAPEWTENDTGVQGLAPYAPIDVVVTDTQTHIVTPRPDGSFAHAYQQIGTPRWIVETI